MRVMSASMPASQRALAAPQPPHPAPTTTYRFLAMALISLACWAAHSLAAELNSSSVSGVSSELLLDLEYDEEEEPVKSSEYSSSAESDEEA